jgi:hypothetical protein
MSRNEETKITIYEFIFPAHSLGIDAYYSGLQFGLSTCINDGDVVGIDGTNQAGQGGWSGWAPYGTVWGGKQAENTGLAALVGASLPGEFVSVHSTHRTRNPPPI